MDLVSQNDKYSYIRFFCDWVLHTEKTRNLDAVREDFFKIALDIEEQEKKTIIQLIMEENKKPIAEFVDFVKLRKQLEILFKKNNINTDLIIGDYNWHSLRNLLFRILANQRIDFKNSPVRGIKSLNFIEVRKEMYGTLLEIEFLEKGALRKKPYIFADIEPNFKICN